MKSQKYEYFSIFKKKVLFTISATDADFSHFFSFF